MVESPPSRNEIPDALLAYDQWLCWRAEERDGKTTKIPFDPTSGEFASATDPETWAAFETARFFTVTADHVDGTSEAIKEREDALTVVYDEYLAPDEQQTSESERADDSKRVNRSPDNEKLLQKAENAANGEKFEASYRGNTAGYESQSEADMALCSLLAFWTGGDARQVDRLFGESRLMREKGGRTAFR